MIAKGGPWAFKHASFSLESDCPQAIRKEAKMKWSHLGLLVLGLVVAAMSDDTRGAQDRAGGAASAPALPYKLVEWPVPATSGAGFPAPWNLIQTSSIAFSAKGTILVLHRGAHPILEFDTGGKFIRSWGDGLFSEGKVGGIPQANWAPERSRYSAVYG